MAACRRNPAAADGPCRFLQRILGRARNIFHFVDGSRKWPLLLSADVQAFVANDQWQVVQTALDQVEVRYVGKAPDQINDEIGLAAYVRGRLHPSIRTKLVAVDRIERSPSGKFEDYVSLGRRAGDRNHRIDQRSAVHTPS